MSVFYDAGVLLAADRNDIDTWAEHRAWLELGLRPRTTAPVVAQASRSPRQANLRRLLRGCEILPFTAEQAHKVGAMLGESGTSDVVDAHLVLLTDQGEVITSDPDDLTHLAAYVDPSPSVRRLGT